MSLPGLVKKSALLSLAFLMAMSLVLGGNKPEPAEAVTGSEWRAGRIIDDSVFLDANSMSLSQVQDFLNAKGGFLASWRDNLVMPFPDKYDLDGNICYSHLPTNMTAAEIIQRAATSGEKRYVIWRRPDGSEIAGTDKANYTGPIKSCREQGFSSDTAVSSISPKVLLTMLQKEQTIVTATGTYSNDPNAYLRPSWPSNEYRLAWAMGYAVPDSGSRQHRYKGFYNQVTYAANQLRRYIDYPQNYNFGVGSRFILWHPDQRSDDGDPACGGGQVNIETRATAALYNYTPYQPNSASLASYPGEGDNCSSYGNRNFWFKFNDWFGSTVGSNYQWIIESFTYSGGDTTIGTGQAETLTLRARNTGRSPWYNHGDNPVRLGTWNPINRASPIAHSSWLANYRPATLQESVVQPNQIGTFAFQIAPATPGTYVEPFNLVAENSQWMDWPGFSPTFNVVGAYNWQIKDVIYEQGTGVMEPGTTQLITLKAKNTGTSTWSKTSGPRIRLGTWPPERQSSVGSNWLSSTRATEMNETTVAPGQTAGFQFYVKMPASGNFYERMNLVAEGQKWFNDPGLTLYLHGKTYSWQPLWHSHSTGTADIPRGTEFTLTLKAKNTGEMTWRKNGNFPIRLATVAPQDRGSALYHSSWIRDTRPVVLLEEEVLPGQEGTFTFTARTPSTPGERFERFSLIAEGILWFNDPGFSIYVNVL